MRLASSAPIHRNGEIVGHVVFVDRFGNLLTNVTEQDLSDGFPTIPEAGIHVLESPHDKRSFDRVAVHVAIAPAQAASPGSDPAELARLALASLPPSNTVVRRYRIAPSPLVRDTVRDWRTGRLDRVLAGEFDVMTER